MRPLAELVRPNIRTLAPTHRTRRVRRPTHRRVARRQRKSLTTTASTAIPIRASSGCGNCFAARKSIAADRIFIGNGSDEAIDLAYRIFCRPGIDNAVSIAPTYGMYRVAAAVNDVELREVPLGDDFSLPVERLLAAADERSKLLWLCSPNNPTGNAFPATEIERLLRRFDGMVVLDEAYVDFADGAGFLPRLDEFPNLIVLQTLSKAWGMAGLRIGLAFAARESQRFFARQISLQHPWSHAAGRRGDARPRPHAADRRDPQRAPATGQRAGLLPLHRAGLPLADQLPAGAHTGARRFYDALIEAGIIVRNRSRAAGCEGCLRLTVGTPAENDRLLRTVKTFRP